MIDTTDFVKINKRMRYQQWLIGEAFALLESRGVSGDIVSRCKRFRETTVTDKTKKEMDEFYQMDEFLV